MTIKYKRKTLVALLALWLPLQGAETPTVAGKDLPKVNGPMTDSRYLAGTGRPFGASAMEAALRRGARRATVPCVALPSGNLTIEHEVSPPAGWTSYRVEAAPFETVKARVRALHEAWFEVKVVNRWGEQGAGMLQNRIPTGNPEASFINRTSKPGVAFFVVDTSATLSGKEPYTITFTRSVAK